jgi:hypothetical protein
MPLDSVLYGFYSSKAVANDCPTVFYSTPEGKEVEVTNVSNDRLGEGYLWDDKVCLGEVKDYLRKGVYPLIDQQLDKEWDDFAVEYGYDDPDWNF